MPGDKVELILHPIRLRILQTLLTDHLTTQEIADRLPGVPASSIYRHLKVLLAGDLVTVAETRPVKGVAERVYRLPQMPHISATDMAGLSSDDYLRYFTTYVATLLRDFDAYIHARPQPDLLADLAGFTETIVYATDREFMEAAATLNSAILPLLRNGPEAGRKRRKFATITHPLAEPPAAPDPSPEAAP